MNGAATEPVVGRVLLEPGPDPAATAARPERGLAQGLVVGSGGSSGTRRWV